jgi:hypothetical protein
LKGKLMEENEAAIEEIIVDVIGDTPQVVQQTEVQNPQPETQLANMLGQDPQLAAAFAQFVANGGQGTQPQQQTFIPEYVDPLSDPAQAQAFNELMFNNPSEWHQKNQQMVADRMAFDNARGNVQFVEQSVMSGLSEWFGDLAPALQGQAREFLLKAKQLDFKAFAQPQSVINAVREALKTKAYDLEALKTKAYDLRANVTQAQQQSTKTPVLAGTRGTPTPNTQTVRRVQLTEKQARAAIEKFGITPQQYAQNLDKGGR